LWVELLYASDLITFRAAPQGAAMQRGVATPIRLKFSSEWRGSGKGCKKNGQAAARAGLTH
jgi:hypothetical protein